MPENTRPSQLLYAFNDKPNFISTCLLAAQQIVPLGVSLIFPVILLQYTQTTPLMAASLVSVAMLAIAVATFLQALRNKWIGSGTFLPQSATANMLAQSMLAIKMGGLPLLFGMTAFGGIVQALFSIIIRFLQKFFPPEVAAMVLLLVGIDLGLMGLTMLFDFQQQANNFQGQHLALFYFVEYLPLILMVILTCWGNSTIKTYSLAIAVIIGYIVTVVLGFMDLTSVNAISHSGWFFIPKFALGDYHFSSLLIVPFVIGALVNTIKISGSLSALQQMQTTNFTEPDMQQISRANMVDSISTILSGLLGGMATNASSSGIAVSLTTGATSRYLAFPFAIFTALLAFCPKLSLLFVFMPKSISGTILLCLGASLFASSIKMLMRYIVTLKQQLCIGISLIFGLSHDVYPEIFQQLPNYIKSLTASSIAIATICAVILNCFFTYLDKYDEEFCDD